MHLLHLRTKLEQGRTLNETGEQFSTLVCGRDGGRIRLRQLRRKNEHFGGCSDDDARPFPEQDGNGADLQQLLVGIRDLSDSGWPHRRCRRTEVDSYRRCAFMVRDLSSDRVASGTDSLWKPCSLELTIRVALSAGRW